MQRLTVVAAAVAAGVITFAFNPANSAALSPRADSGFAVAPAKPKAAPTAKTAKTQKAAPNKTAKIQKATPGKAQKVAALKSAKSTAKRHAKRSRQVIDLTATASIHPEKVEAPTSAAGDSQYSEIIARYAASYGVPVSLAKAVIKIESNYRPNMVGGAGEIGLMQIKPATARMMGYTGSVKGLFDPDTNIKFGMKYLAMAQGLGGGTTCGTILKYNAGHGATRMNPISAAYCSKVKVQMAALGSPA
ncbi:MULTISPECIES: transglycosylase SLT domain-containing protein [unclassified Mesorhizobium]|uniref:lytic transglycosylase domain-containing protein n=1 Tax=unclassified Mesorhizobium TaxID=325217 RepID=UPI000BAFB960|nr:MULTISPECIES: transglycosylase SLT domain-containing protein [unclassified Mesorhizobium]TGT58892.1 lytic transglycosylase domain-containing protein [Mesorhizobium sp. M00.F.Ca.ET.170.01.1.1]AZO12201.1 lytic transglycosylase domain-containing protein [Mesorhizobium sp. M3A.F.Ca.ET.080.04.2.1]PBB84875.1 lytic transglycosylase [Mesorhizobium sp. WSM3876]RWB74913.1 MAG: lytic transglycosylase domain-containing protein [Mesorhizobium sp.]RWB89625.1 MAG: lytic transglycosylase domain-containing 